MSDVVSKSSGHVDSRWPPTSPVKADVSASAATNLGSIAPSSSLLASKTSTSVAAVTNASSAPVATVPSSPLGDWPASPARTAPGGAFSSPRLAESNSGGACPSDRTRNAAYRQRQFFAQEFLRTEQTYVRQLDIILKVRLLGEARRA